MSENAWWVALTLYKGDADLTDPHTDLYYWISLTLTMGDECIKKTLSFEE